MHIGEKSEIMHAYCQAIRISARLNRPIIYAADLAKIETAMMQINAQVDILRVKAILVRKGHNPYRLLCTA